MQEAGGQASAPLRRPGCAGTRSHWGFCQQLRASALLTNAFGGQAPAVAWRAQKRGAHASLPKHSPRRGALGPAAERRRPK